MGSLSDIVTINVVTQTSAAQASGFGIPLIVGCHSKYVDLVRSYTSTDGLVSDGFASTDPEYKAAAAIFAQNPRVPTLKIGRRQNPTTSVVVLSLTAINSGKYALSLNGSPVVLHGSSPAVPVAAASTAVLADIATALKTAIEDRVALDAALTGLVVTKAGDGSTLTLTMNTSAYIGVKVDDNPSYVGHAGIGVEYTHADTHMSADLDAIAAADPDFYGFCLTVPGTTSVVAAAVWAEANKRLLVQASPQTTIITSVASGATDVAATIEAATEYRTAIMFHADTRQFADAAFLGSRLPIPAGSETWKFAQLATITTDRLTDTHLTNLRAKNANGYAVYGSGGITFEGKTAAGEYIDVIRGRDWLQSDMQAAIFDAMVNAAKNGKIPFTDAGIALIEGQVRASLQRGEDRTFLDKGSVVVTAPKALAVSSGDRAARNLTGVSFSARLAGAVHAVTISGTVTV